MGKKSVKKSDNVDLNAKAEAVPSVAAALRRWELKLATVTRLEAQLAEARLVATKAYDAAQKRRHAAFIELSKKK